MIKVITTAVMLAIVGVCSFAQTPTTGTISKKTNVVAYERWLLIKFQATYLTLVSVEVAMSQKSGRGTMLPQPGDVLVVVTLQGNISPDSMELLAKNILLQDENDNFIMTEHHIAANGGFAYSPSVSVVYSYETGSDNVKRAVGPSTAIIVASAKRSPRPILISFPGGAEKIKFIPSMSSEQPTDEICKFKDPPDGYEDRELPDGYANACVSQKECGRGLKCDGGVCLVQADIDLKRARKRAIEAGCPR